MRGLSLGRGGYPLTRGKSERLSQGRDNQKLFAVNVPRCLQLPRLRRLVLQRRNGLAGHLGRLGISRRKTLLHWSLHLPLRQCLTNAMALIDLEMRISELFSLLILNDSSALPSQINVNLTCGGFIEGVCEFKERASRSQADLLAMLKQQLFCVLCRG